MPHRFAALLAASLAAGPIVAAAPARVAAAEPVEPLVTALAGANALGEGLPATDAPVVAHSAVDIGDATYLLDERRLRRIDAAGVITTIHTYGSAPAELATDGANLFVLTGWVVEQRSLDGQLQPWSAFREGIFDIDAAGGRVYAAIRTNAGARVESVQVGLHSWSLVAGGGAAAWGDGGAATAASLGGLVSVAVGPGTNDVYLGQQRAVRRVSAGVIDTVAGSQGATGADSGDGGPATAAVVTPTHLDVAPDGTVYVGTPSVEAAPATVRRFTPSGDVAAFAASAGRCTTPRMTVDADRVLVPCRSVDAYDPATAAAVRVAGSDGTGSSDGTPAAKSWETEVNGIAPGADGRPYFATADRVRTIGADGAVSTVAGGGSPADGWGDGPAAGARLRPRGIAAAADGSVYVVDRRVHDGSRIRRIKDGAVSTVAGGGTGAAADGSAATAPAFSYIHTVAADGAGAVWFVDQDGRVWRIADGVLDHVTTLAEDSNCCALSWDPYGSRMLVARGTRPGIAQLAVDGTVTVVAHLNSGPATAAGPDGTVFGTHGWARRGNVLIPFFGWGIGDNGDEARFSNGVIAQAFVAPDGAFYFADANRRQVRRIDPQPATDAPVDVAAPQFTPGPGMVTVVPDADGGEYQARMELGTVPPAPYDGSGSGIWAGDVGTGTFSVHTLDHTQQYTFALFYRTGRDVLVHSFTVTPLVDDQPPGAVTNLALDVANDTVTFDRPSDPDLMDVHVRWSRGTTPPATIDAGNGGELPQFARYSDVAFSVFALDYAGNVSPPVSIVMPKLTLAPGGPSPAFAGYFSDQADKRLHLSHHGGRVQYAVGTTAPATINHGTRVTCDDCTGGHSSTAKLAYLDNAVYGRRYAFAVFQESDDGLHYTRSTYVAVFGASTTPDAISMASTPGSVVTGGPVTIKGVVKHAATNMPRAASRVELWARTLPSTVYTRVATATTSSTGGYSFTARPKVHTYYQVRSGVNDPLAPAMSRSAIRLVKATPVVSGSLSSARVPNGTRVRLYGSIAPAGVRTLVLQAWTSTGWANVVGRTTDGYGRTSYDVVRGRGTHRYRWVAPASAVLNAANGATLTFVVY